MEKVTIWKRFKGWVTALKNRYDVYSKNLLFVTRVKTLAIHLSFVLALLIIFWVFLDYAEKQILEEVVSSLEQALLSGNTSIEGLETTSSHLKTTYILFFAGIMGVMSIGLYFMAGLTLRPIRRNIESQRRFIADVSHELRTPLSVMQAEAEVALLDGADDQARKEALRVNIEEINRISLIINNLISFTHISGLSPTSFQEVDLFSIVKRAVEKLRHVSKKAEVNVSLSCPNDLTVFGNEIALEQVALNLLKNAIAHTKAGGSVDVSCQEDSFGKVRVSVEDTGEGIPQEDIAKIFEPFFKSGKSKIAERGSVGLGLSIVNEVIRSHKGAIYVDSVLGEGTIISVLLPRSGAKKEKAESAL